MRAPLVAMRAGVGVGEGRAGCGDDDPSARRRRVRSSGSGPVDDISLPSVGLGGPVNRCGAEGLIALLSRLTSGRRPGTEARRAAPAAVSTGSQATRYPYGAHRNEPWYGKRSLSDAEGITQLGWPALLSDAVGRRRMERLRRRRRHPPRCPPTGRGPHRLKQRADVSPHPIGLAVVRRRAVNADAGGCRGAAEMWTWLRPNSTAICDRLMSSRKGSLTIRRSLSLGNTASRPGTTARASLRRSHTRFPTRWSAPQGIDVPG